MTRKIFLFFFLLICTGTLYSQHTSIARQDKEVYSSLNFIDTIPDNYRIFLVGESHNREGNQLIQMNLIRHLHKKGVRVLIFEYPISFEKTLNNYIESGNDMMLEEVLNRTEKNKEYRHFYTSLHKFNSQLPEEEKLIIKCIDVERPYSYDITANTILSLADDTLPLEAVMKVTSKLKSLSRQYDIKRKQILRTIDEINKLIQANENELRRSLNNNYRVFTRIVEGITEMEESRGSIRSREEFMFENVLELLEKYPEAKFFGQFGRIHIPISYQKRWVFVKKWNSMACLLNQDDASPVRGRILSMVQFYPDYKLEKKYQIIPDEKANKHMGVENTLLSTVYIPEKEQLQHPFQVLIVNKFGVKRDH